MAIYQRRIVDGELDLLLPQVPALALEGPKGVGKTETAARRADAVLRLDDSNVRTLVSADLDRLDRQGGPLLVDEWQRLPEVWDTVRRLVDRDRRPGQFLLTGSATPPADSPIHSGAGRIATLRMRPFSLAERGLAAPTVSLGDMLTGGRPPIGGDSSVRLDDYTEEILRSGLPGIREGSGRGLRLMLDSYLDRVVDRDLPEIDVTVRRPALLRSWLRAYAAATATTASQSTILRAATTTGEDAPTQRTASTYIEHLTRMWLIDPVEGWYPTRNRLARLSHPPKHHLADPALSARLLGVSAGQLLGGTRGADQVPRDGPLLGSLFESLVTLSVRVYAQAAEARVYHLRTKGGERELDLIIERDDGRVVAAEIKLSPAVTDRSVRHLLWLRDQLGADLLDMVVVTTGPYAYRRPDGVAVVPAALLGP